jgi:hypothetical protein
MNKNNVTNWKQKKLMVDPITNRHIQKDRQIFVPIDDNRFTCYDVVTVYKQWYIKQFPEQKEVIHFRDASIVQEMESLMDSVGDKYPDICELRASETYELRNLTDHCFVQRSPRRNSSGELAKSVTSIGRQNILAIKNYLSSIGFNGQDFDFEEEPIHSLNDNVKPYIFNFGPNTKYETQ